MPDASNETKQRTRVLLLGDGNLSFALALELRLRLPGDDGVRSFLGIADDADVEVMATTFDSREELLGKYQETKDILPRFRATEIRHRINAWELKKHFPDTRFDICIWNHPHLGTEDFRLHRSVGEILTPVTGKAIVSLVNGQHIRWDIVNQADRAAGLNVVRREPFFPSEWPGYVVKRNQHGTSFTNTATQLQHGKMSSILLCFSFAPADPNAVAMLAQDAKDFEVTPTNAELRRDKSVIKFDWECPHCGKFFRTQRGWKTHIDMIHTKKLMGSNWKPDAPKVMECPNCDRKFASKNAVWQHVVSRHTVLPRSELDVLCEKNGDLRLGGTTLQENSQDESASNNVSWIQSQYVPCDVCGQAVQNQEYGMQLHLETLKRMSLLF